MIMALVLVAVTMALSLAHALEFPGKARLDERTYRAVQAIYYPGFTIGGLIGEFGGMVLLLVLVFILPTGTERFWWVVAGLGLLIVGHAIYWIATHPVNAAWLKESKLSATSSFFFGLFSTQDADWRRMRNIWEYSHVARSVVHFSGFIAMAMALIR